MGKAARGEKAGPQAGGNGNEKAGLHWSVSQEAEVNMWS